MQPSPPTNCASVRLAVCERCPYLIQGLLGKKCKLCGCFVNLKARLASQTCPGGFWPC